MIAYCWLRKNSFSLLEQIISEIRLDSAPIEDCNYLYNLLSPTYDRFYPHSDQKNIAFCRKLIRLLKSRGVRKVIDICCGTGRQTIPLKQQGFDVWGTDQSEGMLERCRWNQKQAGTFFPIQQIPWEGLAANFENEFDAVIMIGDPLVHVPSKKLKSVFKNIEKILHPKGVLILNMRNWEKELKPFLNKRLGVKYTLVQRVNSELMIFGFRRPKGKRRIQEVICWNAKAKKINFYCQTVVYINCIQIVKTSLLSAGFKNIILLKDFTKIMDNYSYMDYFLIEKGSDCDSGHGAKITFAL